MNGAMLREQRKLIVQLRTGYFTDKQNGEHNWSSVKFTVEKGTSHSCIRFYIMKDDVLNDLSQLKG